MAFIPRETNLNHSIEFRSFCTFIYIVNCVVSGEIYATGKNFTRHRQISSLESDVPGHSEESLDGDSKDCVQGASQADLRYWQQDGNKHGEDLQNSR